MKGSVHLHQHCPSAPPRLRQHTALAPLAGAMKAASTDGSAISGELERCDNTASRA
jgi:hypothetical protein